MKKILSAIFACGLLVLLALVFQRNFYEVPVLMYHRVDVSDRESGVYVRPENFEKQMEFLKVHRYHVMPLETLIQDLKARRRNPPKSVVITFDDGTLDNIKNAFPVLKTMGFPATVFMITENIGRPGWLSEEDLKILDEGGVSIGSHTLNHAYLPELPVSRVQEEIAGSKKRLEGILGHEVTLFSYPAGGVTPQIREFVEKAGYAGAVTTNYGKERHDPYSLHRVKVGDSSGNLFNFLAKTSGFYSLGKKRVSHRAADPAPAEDYLTVGQ